MDRAFVAELQRHRYPHLELTTELGNSKSSSALAMSLGINLETVVTGSLGVFGYKTVIDIYAEIFFFDFEEKKIINSIPINIQYITVTKEKPNNQKIRELFRGLIFGTDKDVKKSLFALAAERLENFQPRLDYGTRFKVGKVTLTGEALSQIKGTGLTEDHFETVVAQMFTRALVSEMNIAVVPFTKGLAIGSKMAARFANGDAFTFELPPADYEFNLNFDRLVSKRDTESSGVFDTEAYGVYQTVSFCQPDLKKLYLDERFRAVTTATLQKQQQTLLSVAYLETIFDFYSAFARDLKDPSRGWIKTVVPDAQVSKTKDEMEAVSKILNSSGI